MFDGLAELMAVYLAMVVLIAFTVGVTVTLGGLWLWHHVHIGLVLK